MILILIISFILFSAAINSILPINEGNFFRYVIACILSISLLSYFYISSLFLNCSYLCYIIILLCFCGTAVFFLWKLKLKNLIFTFQINKWVLRFLFVLLIGTIIFTIKSNRWGDWDAWANWHLRAKFLCYDHLWTNIFKHEGTPDYPLMLPSITAMFWKAAGSINPIVPVIIAYLTYISILCVLYLSFSKIKLEHIGLAGVIILTLDAGFAGRAASQYADTILALFILITTILVSNTKEKSAIYYLLIGIFASLTIWVKNEGLIFFIFVSILIFCKNYTQKNHKKILFFLFGIIPIAAVFLYFKIFLAPVNELSKQNINIFESILNYEKHLIILKFFIITLFKQFPILIMLVVAALLFTPKILVSEMVIVLTACCFIYLFIYTLTNAEIYWQLRTSLDRLIHQLYPAFLYCFLNAFKTKITLNPKKPITKIPDSSI